MTGSARKMLVFALALLLWAIFSQFEYFGLVGVAKFTLLAVGYAVVWALEKAFDRRAAKIGGTQ